MTKLEHQHFKAWLVDAEYGPAEMIQQNDVHTEECVMLLPHGCNSSPK